VSTAGATRLSNANENIENLSLSSDGQWVFYDSDLAGNGDIFRLPAAGGEPERLTPDPADDFYPWPSPDGKELAFHSWRGGTRDLYVMRLDGGGVQQVTRSAGQEAIATWSPDGKSLAFSLLGTEEGVWIVGRDGEGRWGEPTRRRSGGSLPAWAPDGKTIAFVSTLTGGDLSVLPMPSGDERTLVDVSGMGGAIVARGTWGRDGTLYFSMNQADDLGSFWSVGREGGAPRLLVRFDPVLHGLYRGSFDVGGGRFFFPTDDRQSDIWVREVAQP
jgi:Tol biopolymer transport system component